MLFPVIFHFTVGILTPHYHFFNSDKGCTYSSVDNMDSNARVLNVASYEACVSICNTHAECNGVTYFTRFFASVNLESTMANELDADGYGPMLCVLKKSTASGLTCNGSEHYQEVVSGEPCLSLIHI